MAQSSTPVRRSSRLKEKGTRKRYQDPSPSSPDSDSGDGERALAVTPSSASRKKKTNNFFKVYHSYNKDYGLDVYEKDFIDDGDMQAHHTPSRSRTVGRSRNNTQARRSLKTLVSSSSSESDGGGRVPRQLVLSSDEEESKAPRSVADSGREEWEEEEEEEVQVRRKNGKRNRSYSTRLNSSSESVSSEASRSEEEGEEGGVRRRRKRPRKMRQLESDEEIVCTDSSVRAPSSRAKRLKEERERVSSRKLQQLAESRSGNKISEQLESHTDTTEDTLDFEEDLDALFNDAFEAGLGGPPDSSSCLGSTLAERILFPPEEDTESSSEGEDSDWIVSDGECEYVDLREMLEMEEGGARIIYHPEGESPGVSAGDGEYNFLPLPLIEAVCSDGGVEAIRKVLEANNDAYTLEATDDKGYTALMHAVDRDDVAGLKVLLEAGASMECKDDAGATPLHLAAVNGLVECVEVLVAHGHPVECRDERGWPPLLYAHFQNHQECVLALMRAKPKQLSVLGDLLKQTPLDNQEDNKKKTLKVIRSLLVSLAHEEAYYSLFNDFIRHHPSVLEEDGFAFLKHCMALLSFENKQAWFKRKLGRLRNYAAAESKYVYPSLSLSNLSREHILSGMSMQLSSATEVKYWSQPLSVTFQGEPGICTGPRKEFFACLSKTLTSGGENQKLFSVCDNSQLSLQPCRVLCRPKDNIGAVRVENHTRLLEFVAMVTAHAVFHGEIAGLHLTTPLIKQLLGLPLEHPSDLEDVDESFYHGITSLLEESGGIEDLELTFTHTLQCPWSGRTLELPVCKGGRDRCVSECNKKEYVECLSRFKLEGCVKHELEIFTRGFWRIIPQKCLQVFTPSELALLISGVPEIDAADWQRNTRYRGMKESESIVQWFWKLVRSLKEEEKALLLKFATGSPCVPPGGFASLQGLGGATPFTIVSIPGLDKIPQAATCFNTLKLTDYSCEQQLRNKVLIAIRYGCEGFEFS